MRTLSLLVVLAAAALVAAQDSYGSGYGDGDGDSVLVSATPSSTVGSSNSKAAASTSLSTAAAAATSGTPAADSSTASGKVCADLMCISATINATTTLYELEQRTSSTLGWMAIGFGKAMAHSPMVILWPNADGSITVSQRRASGEVMPLVDTAPPRIATLSAADSNLTSGAGVLAFSVPNDGAVGSPIQLIWAYGTTNPGSADPAAPLKEHRGKGSFTLAVTSSATPTTNGSTTPAAQTAASTSPLLGPQKILIAHAVLFVVAFMLLLPSGVLFARLLRTTSVNWFRAHWLIQGYITGPVLAVAFLLGFVATEQLGGDHFDDLHKQVGLVLAILYLVQVALGAIIHFVKDPKRARRPPQNYVHAVLGLVILGLAVYQIHLGYASEWLELVGLPAPGCLNAIWVAWSVVFVLVYAAGLTLVPRQYRLEAARRAGRF